MKSSVIGIGGYGWKHVETLLNLEEKGIVAFDCFCEISTDRNAEYIDLLVGKGKRHYLDYVEMFEKEDLDIVGIPCPIHLHKPMLIKALEYGINVMLEKPPCVAIQDYNEMYQMVEKSGKLCAVGFQGVLSAEFINVCKMIEDGVIGKVKYISGIGCYRRPDKYYTRNNWSGKKMVNGAYVMDGTMNNPLSHLLNNCLYLASGKVNKAAMPKEVTGELYRANDIECEDTDSVRIITENGVEINYYVTACSDVETGHYIKIVGEKGEIFPSELGGFILKIGNQEERFVVNEDKEDLVYKNFLNLINCVQGKEKVLISDLKESKAFVLASNGAYLSAGDVKKIPAMHTKIVEEGESKVIEVNNIRGIFKEAADKNLLLSENGVEWAVPSKPYNIEGLEEFNI